MRPRAMIEVPQHLKGRDFTRIGSWSSDELKAVLDVADTLKEAQRPASRTSSSPAARWG